MGRGLILVRHAMPLVSEKLPSTEWRLSEHSKQDCVLLAHILPQRLAGTVYCSNQRKTYDTARVIGIRRSLQIEADDAFREVDKPEEWFEEDEDYRAAAAAYLGDGGRPGWDTHAAVARRFGEGVDRALAANPKGDLVVATHGMALSIYLASRATINLVPFWRTLTFPDAWRFDLDTAALVRLFEEGIIR